MRLFENYRFWLSALALFSLWPVSAFVQNVLMILGIVPSGNEFLGYTVIIILILVFLLIFYNIVISIVKFEYMRIVFISVLILLMIYSAFGALYHLFLVGCHYFNECI